MAKLQKTKTILHPQCSLDQTTSIRSTDWQRRQEKRGVGFLRGDVDCTLSIDIVDPIVLLQHMFLGADTPCCEAAADVNGDGAIDIEDPIFSLLFLFLGNVSIPAPNPECGLGFSNNLTCEMPTCF